MSDVSVRTARNDDVNAVGEVQAQVWRRVFGPHVEAETSATFTAENFADAWRTALTNPPSPVHRLLVATEGTEVVGFVAIAPDDSAGGQILAGGVADAHGGRGHGSRLLNAAIDTLAANNITDVGVRIPEQDTYLVRFLATAGFALSGGYADRVVTTDGKTIREIKLRTQLVDESNTDHDGHNH